MSSDHIRSKILVGCFLSFLWNTTIFLFSYYLIIENYLEIFSSFLSDHTWDHTLCELLKWNLIEMEWDNLSMRSKHGLIHFLLEFWMISQLKSQLISRIFWILSPKILTHAWIMRESRVTRAYSNRTATVLESF